MSWITWRQYRYAAALAAALLAALAVLLLITGLHAASIWHADQTTCAKRGSCGNLSLGSSALVTLIVALSAVPLLPGLFCGAPMVANELEAGTNQFAWTQSITRRHWLVVRTGWLLLAAAVLAGAVSVLVTWWSGPYNALQADAFQLNRFDITDIVPVGYALFAMALGICAGTLLRRTVPALAVTLAGFVGVRALIALWLRLHYMTPVTAYYKLTAPFVPAGSYLGVGQGVLAPNGKPVALNYGVFNWNGVPLFPACNSTNNAAPCLAAHGYRGWLSYQPASRFWTFQGIETAIFVVLAAALLLVTLWVLERRDA